MKPTPAHWYAACLQSAGQTSPWPAPSRRRWGSSTRSGRTSCVSDVGMPEEDGYDLLRQVRARFSASDLPAAALTAFARSEDRKRALLAGFQTHVAKPVDPSELVAVVASLAGRTGRS